MKTAGSALIAYLNGTRGSDAPLFMADCYTITLASGSVAGIASGTVLAVTSLDVPVLLNGITYVANSFLVDGLKYRCSIGVSVDQQQVTLSSPSSMTVGGVPFLQAVQQGLLDGAEIQRDRAFFTSFSGNLPLVPIGSILLFKGRVADVTSVGRTSASVNVASDLTLLAIDMPWRRLQTNCLHVLYDGGCKAARSSYTFAGSVGSGSSVSTLNWSGANSNFQQGALTFTSGANTGVTATITGAGAGYLSLGYPLPNVPSVGDTFTAAYGCDHTTGTCASRFSNFANFVGFPFIPPPTILTGPLSATGPSSVKG